MARKVKSSKSGKVHVDSVTITDVTNITGPFEGQHDMHEYASSSTAGRKKTIAGHIKAAGSFSVIQDKFDAGLAAKLGISVDLTIQYDGTPANTAFSGQAVLSLSGTEIPVEDGGVIRKTIDWAEAEA